jgi:nucleoside-diphosphate-sugar epimerase
MKIFVTGASGAIGRPAVSRLLQAGHEVTALVRSDGTRDELERAGARAVPGSLFDADALRTALAGHDAVVNLATHVPSAADAIKPGAWREDDRIRAEGSHVLTGAALAAGVGHLVQGSVTFIYPDSGDSWITEQTSPAPNPKSQAATMTAAASATRFAAHGGIGVVLRFGLFYGPDRNSGETLARVRAGKPVVLGQPAGWLSPLHPEDAAGAVAAALACDSGTYNVCETPVLRSDWAAAIGRAAREEAAADPAKFYPRLLQRLAGTRAEPLTRSHRVSSAAFSQATGWRPHYDCLRGGWSDSPAAASSSPEKTHGSRTT